ncbi:MAG: septum formation initiator family protein [Thermoleophilaceae bacterium]|nr:septum formation initiator family protein [Thermoleophilaceae bacterium]
MAHTAAVRRGRAPRRSPRPARATRRAPRGGIRWDRVGRLWLLLVLGVILLLYISPLHRFVTQSRTAGDRRSELRALEAENKRLRRGIAQLRSPGAVEREARELGMVKVGERAYVIENVPGP